MIVGCAEAGLRRDEVFHDDAADAMSGHFRDLKAAAFVVDTFARNRDVAELREKKAREGFDSGFAREDPVELVAEVAQGGRSSSTMAPVVESRGERLMSNSSSSSPTICSRMSSAVTRPTVEPNSSTAMAMWRRRS